MMTEIEIHHQIDETHKEIYGFGKDGRNVWVFTSIMYSNRDDKDDIWGDEWSEHPKIQAEKQAAFDEKARKLGHLSFQDMKDNVHEEDLHQWFSGLENKFNPVCLKTKSGEGRYHGISFGCYCKRPAPKMSEEEIKAAILKQVSNIKIRL